MLRHDVIHQMPDLGRHVPDGGAEVTDLIGTAHIYFRFQIARLNPVHRTLQFFDRCRNPRGNVSIDDREDEYDKGNNKHDQDPCLQRV